MLTSFLFGLKIFVFVFAILYIISRILNVVRVLRLKEGKIDTSRDTLIAIGLALSYIITVLILGI
jgi:hypothetical protein